jgi:hypothetical protein
MPNSDVLRLAMGDTGAYINLTGMSTHRTPGDAEEFEVTSSPPVTKRWGLSSADAIRSNVRASPVRCNWLSFSLSFLSILQAHDATFD